MSAICDVCGWAPATGTGDLPNWGTADLCDHCFNLMGYTADPSHGLDAIPIDADYIDID
jgi:hypothetical protein